MVDITVLFRRQTGSNERLAQRARHDVVALLAERSDQPTLLSVTERYARELSHLGDHHNFVSGEVELLDRLPEDNLRQAIRIALRYVKSDVGSLVEVD